MGVAILKSLLNCLALTFQHKLQNRLLLPVLLFIDYPSYFWQGNGFCTEYKCRRQSHRSGNLMLASHTAAWN